VPQWLYTVWMPVLCVAVCARIGGRIARVLHAAADVSGRQGGGR
jgi:hypothetical protein